MHTLPKIENAQFESGRDGTVAVVGTDYTIELGYSRWRICLAGKPVLHGYRTLRDAKLAFDPAAVAAA